MMGELVRSLGCLVAGLSVRAVEGHEYEHEDE